MDRKPVGMLLAAMGMAMSAQASTSGAEVVGRVARSRDSEPYLNPVKSSGFVRCGNNRSPGRTFAQKKAASKAASKSRRRNRG